MQSVFIVTLVYSAFAMVLTGFLYGDLLRTIDEAFRWVAIVSSRLVGQWTFLVPFFLVVVMLRRWLRPHFEAREIFAVLAATILSQVGFSFLKNSIPEFVPFYADPMLSELDRWLHYGVDPWSITHQLIASAYVPWMPLIYYKLWVIAAIAFPLIVVASDNDHGRATRYVWLYFGSWLVIGNILALAGSSVGPVYFDRLLHSDRFVELTRALQETGLNDTTIGRVQAALRSRFEQGRVDFGLGISAFPSMHVTVASITALYMIERSKWLAPIGIAFLVAILFISVYSGYHYAVDGYVAIIVVVACNYVFAKFQCQRPRNNLA